MSGGGWGWSGAACRFGDDPKANLGPEREAGGPRFVLLLLCLSRFCHLPAEITSTGRAGDQMQGGASGYNSGYIAYEIRCLQGWRSHERL